MRPKHGILVCLSLAACAPTAAATSPAVPSQHGVAGSVDGRAPNPASSATSARGSGAAGTSATGRPMPQTPAPAPFPSGGPTAATAQISVRLAFACVAPGQRQYITITTPRQSSVTFNTHYPDGKSGSDYGGVAIGTTTTAGTYQNGWTVASGAPLGVATVEAGASRDGSVATAPGVRFNVAAHC
jgi:hypothetical protein